MKYKIVEEGKPAETYREWCVPAALINEHATVTLMANDEVEDMTATIWRGYLDPPSDV